MSEEYWQKPYVQRVLYYHNEEHGTDIDIVDRCDKVHPELRGKLNWDWVCRDRNSGSEIAVEVKSLTAPQLKEKYSVFHQFCQELSEELCGKLPGTFILFIPLWEQEHFDLRGDKKQKFKDTLKELILQAASGLGIGGEQTLTQELRERLPEALPLSSLCDIVLVKFTDKDSYLDASPSVGGFYPANELQGEDLIKFKELIQKANEQLAEARKRGIAETILILRRDMMAPLVIGGRHAADIIQNTLQHFDPLDYCFITHCYYYGGREQDLVSGDTNLLLYQIDLPRHSEILG